MKLLPHPPVSQKKNKKCLPQTHTRVRSMSISCCRNSWLVRIFYQSISNICVSQTLCPSEKGVESLSKLIWTLIIIWPSGGKVGEKVTLMLCVPLHQEGLATAWEPEIHHSFPPLEMYLMFTEFTSQVFQHRTVHNAVCQTAAMGQSYLAC